MKRIALLAAAFLIVSYLFAQTNPIALHPENPHYFIYHGKPTILITSGEHYGAVLNLDFDYLPYLDELKSRIKSYAYVYRIVRRAQGCI